VACALSEEEDLMQAIILAGGFGKRLRHLVPENPKPMADIHGKPFLSYLLAYLALQGVKQIVLSTHYLHEKIADYFSDNYKGISIQQVREQAPLGTGGAIVNCLKYIDTKSPLLVVNGDTIVEFNLARMLKQHQEKQSHITIVLKYLLDNDRYGKITLDGDKIITMASDDVSHPGYVNMGCYLIDPSIFDDTSLPDAFSFEKMFLPERLSTLKADAYVTSGYFIDIGIPEDYRRACSELPRFLVDQSVSNQENVKKLYASMLLTRLVEEHVVEQYHTDVIKSPVHLSIGQEFVATAICEALEKDDFVSNSYRCHATYLAKGGDLPGMMAELYGKKTGCAAGKAGSMHLVDIKHGVLGASAVVATTIPVATGYAFALKQQVLKDACQKIIVSVFGDGAVEEGEFFESLNFAAMRQLPIIYVCENNGLAIHSPLKNRWATSVLCERVSTYNIPTYYVDSGDVFELFETMKQIVSSIRANEVGPVFVECKTYRWMEHVGPGDDNHEKYRDHHEYLYWKTNDQIKRLADMLPDSIRLPIENKVKQQVEAAVEFSKNSPFPDKDELLKNVYAEN
jgi:TPP-dependent pyruvate/acetoin dehydrogenase alpha subunit/choline kinase